MQESGALADYLYSGSQPPKSELTSINEKPYLSEPVQPSPIQQKKASLPASTFESPIKLQVEAWSSTPQSASASSSALEMHPLVTPSSEFQLEYNNSNNAEIQPREEMSETEETFFQRQDQPPSHLPLTMREGEIVLSPRSNSLPSGTKLCVKSRGTGGQVPTQRRQSTSQNLFSRQRSSSADRTSLPARLNSRPVSIDFASGNGRPNSVALEGVFPDRAAANADLAMKGK